MNTAQRDQFQAACRDMVVLFAELRDYLESSGFSRSEAFDLVLLFAERVIDGKAHRHEV